MNRPPLLTSEERRELRILWLVLGGFVCGVVLLFFLIATDV